MKLLRFCLLLLAVVDSSCAFQYTPKKREQRRPAFKASPVVGKDEASGGTPAPATAKAAAATAAFAFAPALAYSHQEDALDDEELIGYGTALVTCFISLALGFGLGYGT